MNSGQIPLKHADFLFFVRFEPDFNSSIEKGYEDKSEGCEDVLSLWSK